jgi:hypothetical protein
MLSDTYLHISKVYSNTNCCPRLLTIHIPKCGGTALNSYLSKSLRSIFKLGGMGLNYKNQDMFSNDLHTFHFTSNITKEMEKVSSPILIIIREPIERIKSEFFFLKHHISKYITIPSSIKNRDFQHWVSEETVHNGQLSFLLGHSSFSHIPTKYDWNSWQMFMKRKSILLIPLEEVEELVPLIISHIFNVKRLYNENGHKGYIRDKKYENLGNISHYYLRQKNFWDYRLYEKAKKHAEYIRRIYSDSRASI